MKITLTDEQKVYMNALMDSINERLHIKRQLSPEIVRISKKMKHKFRPEALFVNITNKDKQFLASFLGFRQNDLLKRNLQNKEFEIIQSLMRSFGV